MNDVPIHVKNQPARQMAHHSGKPGKSKRKVVGVIIGLVAVVAVFVFVGWLFVRSSVNAQIDTAKYQAVFFTNGQVYFGKLKPLSGGYFKLNDIFYLQSKDANDSNPQKTDNTSPDVQLIKLGSEIHGPTDEMVISKDQVLFFENLKSDSKVSASIEKYNNDQK
jgi:hypothetical protein